MIRQLGSPNIFFSKSVNETGMVYLIKSLQEKYQNKVITYEEAKAISKYERRKLIKKYPIDVVHHLDVRFRHHIAAMKKTRSLGEYSVADFFYRVEFSKGGAPISIVYFG